MPDRDPVYKINIDLTIDDLGNLDSIGVVHTVRSGKTYDRSQQYSTSTIWRSEVPIGCHNSRDGWMYRETIYKDGSVEYQMHADCHLVTGALGGGASARAPNENVTQGKKTTSSTAYDASWYISNFWSGEWPAGFSVIGKHTVVTARAKMDKGDLAR
ncbi:MAG TPA: hypothetical protein VGJ20_15240 [Xanthobacteraceae bacterium]